MIFQLLLAAQPLGAALAPPPAAAVPCVAAIISVAGDPEAVIAKTVKEQGIDMLVMGAYTHSRLRALFFGSKTNGLLRSATIPTLLLR